MADKFTITVDADVVIRALDRAKRAEVRKIERAALTELGKQARTAARAEADPGAARYIKSSVKRGAARVSITHGGYRLLASGTGARHTQSGAYRGYIIADPFMERAAARIDPRADEILNDKVREGMRRAGLDVK
jgi:hypothetical protein